jgi:spoIIIJ-associated protein
MLDDLVFKGKSLDEALAKASNFFGADKKSLVYVTLDEAPGGETWIKLTEYPRQQAETEDLDIQPEIDPQAQKLGMAHVMKPALQPRQREHRPARQQQPRDQRSDRRGADRRESGRIQDRPGGGRPRNAEPKTRRQDRQPEAPPRQEQSVDSLGESEQAAYKLVMDILRHAHLSVSVTVVQDQARTVFNIEGQDRNILLAKKGAALTAIQYLVNKIIYNKKEKPNKIFVDSLGYRVSREEELREIALLSAEKVRATKKEYTLNPMNPYERRLIHLALKDEKDITTVSRGEGFIKQVSIIPK